MRRAIFRSARKAPAQRALDAARVLHADEKPRLLKWDGGWAVVLTAPIDERGREV